MPSARDGNASPIRLRRRQSSAPFRRPLVHCASRNGKGRIETRTATVSTDIAWLIKDHQWPGLAAVGKIERIRETAGKTTFESAYYLLSAPLTPERFNEVVRSHWGVENRLHWRLDVVMNEDQDRSRLGNGPHNLAVLRHMALNVMQKDGEKGSLRGKFKRASWEPPPEPQTGTSRLRTAQFSSRDSAVWAYNVKSLYLTNSRRANEGLSAAEAGLAIKPDDPPLYRARGVALLVLGHYEQAISDVQQAMRLSPRDPRIGVWLDDLGNAELGLGHFDAAIDKYHKAIDAGWRAYQSYRGLAAAYALDGKMEEAASALAEARRLNPALTLKWLQTHSQYIPPLVEGLRKAGLPEE